jgi:hypothetical protein
MSASDADIFLFQEVRLLHHQIGPALDWCRRRGFEAVFEPAKPSDVGGMPSGGVAIVARSHLGLVAHCEGAKVTAHRAVAASVDVPGAGKVLLVSVYLDVEDRLGSINLALLADVGHAICVSLLRWWRL